MRILLVEPGPAFSVQDVHAGYTEAFRNLGCQTVSLNLGDRLGFYDTHPFFVDNPDPVGVVRMAAKGIEAACFEFWPDVLFVTSCFFVPTDLLDLARARGIKVVINHLESPYEDGRQAARADHADLNLVNDPTNIDRFPPGTVYMPAAYRPTVHRPAAAQPELVSEFVFTGTGFPSRIAFLEAVDWAGVDVALAGQWQSLDADSPLRKFVAHDINECVDNDQTAAMYQSSLTSANLYRVESERPELATGWAVGPREIELAATGLWFARQSRPEGDALFPMLPVFDTPDELGDIVRWALANPDMRDMAATAARAAIADRTFEANAARLLSLLAA